MDGYFWDGSDETQRRPPPLVPSASFAGELPSFGFPDRSALRTARGTLTSLPSPAEYTPSSTSLMDPTGFFAPPAPPFPPDLFPFAELSGSASWDTTPATSWLPAPTPQQDGPQWDPRATQPQWDGSVSSHGFDSFGPAAARPPSTSSSSGDLSGDSYGIDLLMAEIRRIFDLKYLKTREELKVFSAWLTTLADPHGVLKRWWGHKTMHRWLLRGVIQCLSNIPLEQWNTMEATTNLGEAQHAWNNAQTGISMGVVESFKKYEALDIRRAEEIEVRKSTAVSRTSRNEVTHRYGSRVARQSRMSERARRARTADSTVAGLQTELSAMREDLKAAREDVKAEPSTEAAQHVRELEDSVADLEGELRLAKAEAKSNSSGRVRAPRAAGQATLPAPPQSAHDSTPPLDLTPLLPPPATAIADRALNIAGPRRASTRKRPQAESSATVSTSSSKRRKKLEDPLVGWVMQDPDTAEELTGHEWVKRYPDEFAKRYKKDHQRYLEYLAQSVNS